MQNVKDAANAASEKVKGKAIYIPKLIDKYINNLPFYLIEVSSGTSYEANKEAAKNDNLSASNRVSCGVNAVNDKGM